MIFGMDTTTEEGREAFKQEWENMCQMVPEMISKEDMIYPHEHQRYLSTEPHFRRIWQHYREHMFSLRFSYLVQEGQISQEDADAFRQFVDLSHAPTFNMYIYGRLGQLPHLEHDSTYQATVRVMEKLGLDHITIDRKTAQPYEEQFWEQFDTYMELNEEEMIRELPTFVTDPSNRSKVEALLAGRKKEAVGAETTERLAAAL